MKKPLLILQLRPEDLASDKEFEAFLHYSNLHEDDVVRIRMEKGKLPNVHLDDYSAVIVGGGPSNASDSLEDRYDYQVTFEAWLESIIHEIAERDFPYLGACYGLGILTRTLGGRVAKEQSEPVVAIPITLTESGSKDPLLKHLPESFYGVVGHKESSVELPEGFELLATGETCKHQLVRYKNNIYATQFHPELDATYAAERVDIYKDMGYFPVKEADTIKSELLKHSITVPQLFIKAFVEHYRQ